MAELRAVHLALEQADRLGIPTPIDYGLVREHFDLLQASLRGEDYDYTEAFPSDPLLPGTALAQHQGVPTRLLDWTESPLVASFFAAWEASSVNPTRSRRKVKRLAVVDLYVAQIEKLGKLALVQAPRHANNFLRVQKGVFTYVPSANNEFLLAGRWPTLEQVYSGSGRPRGWLRRTTLPVSEADALLRLLWKYDVTRHHLMPTLDNAAHAFRYKRDLFKRR